MDYIGVILVGAGPGDAELLTIKALRAIQAADVIVYDRLVSDEIMALVPRGIPRIYAGKSCKHKAMPQEEINQLLVTLSKKYTRVVRLKGGDPFMFGRGGEEMLALHEAGVACDIIPGITSAQGCAASVGIPLTHRGLATSVCFITGHREQEKLELDWARLADADTTLVIYMGLTNIAEISRELVAHGLAAKTPAAIIERGTTPKQRVIISTLHTLAEDAAKHHAESPSLIIIGKVVGLYSTANEAIKPLFQAPYSA